MVGHDYRVRVPAEQGGHGLAGIGYPAGVFGRLLPQLQKAVNVAGGASTHYQWHRFTFAGRATIDIRRDGARCQVTLDSPWSYVSVGVSFDA
jgi:hypothetical protein